ncbi:hypothetical protein B0J14DRAFT_704219 [Halenospora varia]|nr:hypothetical protein B0J14DRAFT_704219 [Halenospora varia]
MLNYRKQPYRIQKRARRQTKQTSQVIGVKPNSPALKDKLDVCTPPTSNNHRVLHHPFTYCLTPALLRDFDDIATDLLVDSVYPEVTVRKANSAYSPTVENRKDIVSIIKNVVIKQNAPATAVSLLLQVSDLKTFLDNLVSAEDKERNST